LQRGLRRISLLLVSVALALTIFIFAANSHLGHGVWPEAYSVVAAFSFSLAIAIGLTLQLLPTTVTISLTSEARRLAREKVIVRHLAAIDALGTVETLFSDKTGTLTEGKVVLQEAVGPSADGQQRVLDWSACWLGAGAHVLSTNVLDAALALDERVRAAAMSGTRWTVIDEMPFSYQRRFAALSVVAPDGSRWTVVKGAAEEVLARCDTSTAWGDDWKKRSGDALEGLLARGAQALAVAVRPHADGPIENQAAGSLDLVGFLAFSDPPKLAAKEALAQLHALNVEVKILTGDHPAVAKYVCDQLAIDFRGAVTGAALENLTAAELTELAEHNTVFARVTPEQKAAIIAAVQMKGRKVGFLGYGVDDEPALRQADVRISVDDATDVAKASADVVLLEKDMGVLAIGIREGRRTLANTVRSATVTRRGSGHTPWATVGEMRMEALVIAALFITTLAMCAYLFINGTDFVQGNAHASTGAAAVVTTSTSSRQVPVLTLPQAPARPDFYLPDVVPTSYKDIEIAFLSRLNGQRQSSGLRPLQASTALNLLADIRVRQMIDQGYVGHVDPYGYTMYVELLNLFAISYSQAGEIVGKISASSGDPSLGIVTAFMNSPDHRSNILAADFSLVGVGEADSPDGTHYFAAIFLN
jgi:uncharacterized protein YkwD/soluble P-type ATPase